VSARTDRPHSLANPSQKSSGDLFLQILDWQSQLHATVNIVAIVEDDAAMRKSIERLLQASGYATAAFASAEEFLQGGASVEGAIGLVLDIHLGGISGFELRRRLNGSQSRVPVVFITAHDDEATRAEAAALGCVDYLQKPFDAARLTQALERGRAMQSANNFKEFK